MKRAALLLGLALLVSGAGSAEERRGPEAGGRRNSYANPSAVIAAELAFAQAAQDRGQWTAFAESAAPDAVMFVPEMVWAQGWLKNRANPPVAVKWQPHIVWSSCDGSLMVSHGAWQRPGATGWFTTIWQRQRKGGYKWVLDHGDALKEPLLAPEMLSGLIADCPARRARADNAPPPPHPDARPKKGALPPLDPAHRAGQSDDGSLRWEVTVDPSGARNLSVSWTKGGAQQPVVIEQVDAPAPRQAP